MPFPATDSIGPFIANGKPPSETAVVTGYTTSPTRKASAYAAERTVGKKATARPARLQDTRTSLASRRRLTADGP